MPRVYRYMKNEEFEALMRGEEIDGGEEFITFQFEQMLNPHRRKVPAAPGARYKVWDEWPRCEYLHPKDLLVLREKGEPVIDPGSVDKLVEFEATPESAADLEMCWDEIYSNPRSYSAMMEDWGVGKTKYDACDLRPVRVADVPQDGDYMAFRQDPPWQEVDGQPAYEISKARFEEAKRKYKESGLPTDFYDAERRLREKEESQARAALKEELKAELRDELKAELRDELKSELGLAPSKPETPDSGQMKVDSSGSEQLRSGRSVGTMGVSGQSSPSLDAGSIDRGRPSGSGNAGRSVGDMGLSSGPSGAGNSGRSL